MKHKTDLPPYASYRRPHQSNMVKGSIGVRTALCVFLCAAAFFCKQYYPHGAEVMGQIVFGTENSVVHAAFADFTDAMTQGAPVASCFTELCNEIFTENKH